MQLSGGALNRRDAKSAARQSRNRRRADILVNACQLSKWKSGRIAQIVASMPSNDPT
jgi:hypothetical protein